MTTLLIVLKLIGLALAIVIPGGFIMIGLWILVAPKVLRFIMKRLEKELTKP